jgi:hypothetical protein
MSRRNITLIVVAVVAVAAILYLRSYFSPARVIERSMLAAIEAFEQERILGAIKPISRSYEDRWGLSYETIAGHMRQAMETYDSLELTLEPPRVSVDGETATLEMRFVLWGSYEGTRGYVIGSLTEPCTATFRWSKETPGWRIVATAELDIPELRDELAAAASQ